LGCLGRVISFPLGFVMLVLGKWRLYLLTETSFNIIHVTLINLGLQLYGLEGVAIAFFVLYAGYIIAVYLICRHLIGFAWSVEFKKIAVFTLPSFGATFVACRNLSLWPASFIGLSLTLVVSVFCLRALAIRVGPEHRIVRAIARLPGAKSLLPVS
jgi:antigen flippase